MRHNMVAAVGATLQIVVVVTTRLPVVMDSTHRAEVNTDNLTVSARYATPAWIQANKENKTTIRTQTKDGGGENTERRVRSSIKVPG